MVFFIKYILIFSLCLYFSFSMCSYANNSALFLSEIQSKRDSQNKGLDINLFLLSDFSNSGSLFSVQVNPFYKSRYIIKNVEIRANFIDYDSNDFYSNKNYELAFVYNVIKSELLTLYVNYGIYSMYNLRFYDFESNKEISETSYGKSFNIGAIVKIYRNFYLSAEKRWVNVDSKYITNINNFYLGLNLKIPLEMLKEV
jgi:hypothetical protein